MEKLTAEALAAALGGAADFRRRPVRLGGRPGTEVTACWIEGMVRLERANDYVLRPLAQDRRLGELGEPGAYRALLSGGLYDLSVGELAGVSEAVEAVIAGDVALLFPALGKGLRCGAATEEKRAIAEPANEPAVKGAMDAFVESVRTNTSLVRRRLRSPLLRVEEETVGRQTRTPIDILYVKDVARAETVARAKEKLAAMDVDGVLAAGNLEQYLTDQLDTPFPTVFSTQRPDRFCANLLRGRVGLIADGIPLGFLLPGTVGLFFATEQDRTDNWVTAGCLAALRYAALAVTLLLPAVYVSAALFHPEMIPLALAKSIIAAEEGVPFGALFEVVMLLLAFEIIQEAGLRLPGDLGQTVSILGGLVAGSAAVEAKIVSPAILIVVAIAGIAGYTIPSQDWSGAARLWRFILAILGGACGFLGVALGSAALVGHLAGLESCGAPYLAPFAGTGRGDRGVFRGPMPRVKFRPGWLAGKNRRSQA